MAYERRGGRFYYYRKRWERGTCRSEYIGPVGDRAALFCSLDALDRERRAQEQAEAQAARSGFAELAATPPELTALLAEARTEVARVLTEAGYHQHKRQWRKKRGKKESA